MPKLLGGVHIFAVHIFAEMHKERAIFPRYFGGFSYEAKNRGGRGNLNQSFQGLRVFINVERNKKPLRKNVFSSPFSFFPFSFFSFFLFSSFSFFLLFCSGGMGRAEVGGLDLAGLGSVGEVAWGGGAG